MNKAEFEDVQQKFRKETKQRKISKYLNYLSITFASLGIVASANYFLENFKINSAENNINSTEVQNLNKQIKILKLEIQKNQKIETETTTKIVPNNAVNSSKEFVSLKKEVENLNNFILESPEKAITIPLLKNEIKNQKEQNEKELKSIKDDITRVYDMNKWIIGLVFTMLVSIIVLNVSNLFSKTKKE